MAEPQSVLTCPNCGYRATEAVPACVHFNEGRGCGSLLKPLSGDCCVFCSYGGVPCPPARAEGACGGRSRPAD